MTKPASTVYIGSASTYVLKVAAEISSNGTNSMYDYTGTLKVECEGQDFSQTYTFTEAETVEVSIPTKRAGTFDVTITASDSQEESVTKTESIEIWLDTDNLPDTHNSPISDDFGAWVNGQIDTTTDPIDIILFTLDATGTTDEGDYVVHWQDSGDQF